MGYLKISILLLVGALLPVNGQENKADQLYLTNGELLEVTIKKVEPNTITYSFFGEDLENIAEKANVAKILFKNGREQLFSDSQASAASPRPVDFEYPPMKANEGAVLPFEFVVDGSQSPENGIEAQEFYYDNLMRKPERNTISYQDAETTRNRLRAAGVKEAVDMRDYDMKEIAKIVGAGILVTGKITVDYRTTTSTTTGSTTTKVDTKKKKVKSYSSDYSTSSDEFDTKVDFKIYDMNGNKVVDQTRRPFMASTRENYVTALNYFMKRTPYYQK
ncbi:hypothetical protein [Maribacter halichondriae]|uniref:hypothetical protein n=1 Tax=Maribacter halichondriae TaxID=2980554 RepID=UPI0023583FB4|nr:hypothetical protein [Maribacter sp. Hal144]